MVGFSSSLKFGAAVIVALRRIVSNVPVPLALCVPIFAPLKFIPNSWLKEKEKVFVPSPLWAMTVLPLASVLVEPAPIPSVFVPLYFVPLTVTLHFLLAPELIEACAAVIS